MMEEASGHHVYDLVDEVLRPQEADHAVRREEQQEVRQVVRVEDVRVGEDDRSLHQLWCRLTL